MKEEAFSDLFLSEVVESILMDIRKRFKLKPKVAIAGFSKAGKSSLFNAIFGRNIAKVSMRTDETIETQTKEKFGVDFTDTPGIGTDMFSLEKVVETGVLDKQHVVIHCLNGAAGISEDDQNLHRAINKSAAKRLTAVNKVDILDEREKEEYTLSIKEKLALSPEKFIFISAKRNINITELIVRINMILPAAMQDAFISQQQANISLKRSKADKVIYSNSILAGAAALVPIPVADIAVITPMQIAMVATIGHFYGVEISKKSILELLSTIGAGMSFREIARQIIKFIPGYGQAVSATIAFAGTVALGKVAVHWFENNCSMPEKELKEAFKNYSEMAKKEYEQYKGQVEESKDKADKLVNGIKEHKKDIGALLDNLKETE